ncbi:hypothetical protein J6590_022440 [Homalodisca vitripennis]|nr:hypothetical protein J6590_022440 [Homalodisca vitripennis]
MENEDERLVRLLDSVEREEKYEYIQRPTGGFVRELFAEDEVDDADLDVGSDNEEEMQEQSDFEHRGNWNQRRVTPPDDVTSGRCSLCDWKKYWPSKTRCSKCKFFICREHSSVSCVSCDDPDEEMESVQR